MACCNSYPSCEPSEISVCEPLGTTNEGYRVIVEDIAFCNKAMPAPETASALQYGANFLLGWKDGSESKPFSLPQLQGATGATGYAGIVGVKSNGDFIQFVAATGATGATGYDIIANSGSGWQVVSGAQIGSDQPKGGGSNRVFFENDIIVTDNYTITTNKNAMSAGPISVAAGVTVTVPSGSAWTVV